MAVLATFFWARETFFTTREQNQKSARGNPNPDFDNVCVVLPDVAVSRGAAPSRLNPDDIPVVSLENNL